MGFSKNANTNANIGCRRGPSCIMIGTNQKIKEQYENEEDAMENESGNGADSCLYSF
ncbi:MAG: hypothetical protein PHV18_05970 [Lachnospiraceae bacterium]|nr:hypothetical protein [Lachnospiraceae bacterium]